MRSVERGFGDRKDRSAVSQSIRGKLEDVEGRVVSPHGSGGSHTCISCTEDGQVRRTQHFDTGANEVENR